MYATLAWREHSRAPMIAGSGCKPRTRHLKHHSDRRQHETHLCNLLALLACSNGVGITLALPTLFLLSALT